MCSTADVIEMLCCRETDLVSSHFTTILEAAVRAPLPFVLQQAYLEGSCSTAVVGMREQVMVIPASQ